VNLTFKTILIAPLDWGLGHATRCIPVIRTLINMGNTVIIATSGKQKSLLQTEFPELKIIELNGYNVHYTKNKRLLPFVLLLQSFKIFKAIRHEKNGWHKL